MSTKAPKSMTFLTVPVNTMPSVKSSSFNTSFLRIGFGMSSLGSLPGFVSSSMMSDKVISPMSRSFAVFAILTSFRFCFSFVSVSFSKMSCGSYPICFNKFSAFS